MNHLKSIDWLNHLCRIIFCIVLAFLLAGCLHTLDFPMQATKKQLKNIKESEGVIIGSVLINKEKESSWNQQYTLRINQLIKSLFLTNYNLTVTQGEEKTFIKNLPAGDYEINTVTIHSFFSIGVSGWVSPEVFLSVKPNKTTYVGKLVITFHGSRYHINVKDDQTNTMESLKEEYSDLISTVDKNLMVLGLQRYKRYTSPFRIEVH